MKIRRLVKAAAVVQIARYALKRRRRYALNRQRRRWGFAGAALLGVGVHDRRMAQAPHDVQAVAAQIHQCTAGQFQ